MDSRRWERLKQIFDEAYERPPDERMLFVEEACGDDEALQAEIRKLFGAEDSVHSMLDGVALDAAETLDHVTSEGKQVGPYILKRLLGAGGMGEVYLAERADGQFEHQVALKLIRHGAQSSQIEARFRSERQILARLQHPNIARLLDGGLSEEGHPYFVLEYIEGRPIDEYANENELGIDRRLELFAQVCRAVTYAHMNLVVHRDLKPSNVLVTDDGRVKLLDFGIAKVLSDDETDEPLTRTDGAVMTPAYASPEQARGEAVNTSTDIYSLGVILYELLTGLRPYEVSNNNPIEAARVICEVEPERPSSTATHSTTYGSDTGRLRRLLAGDLDVICLKALRKEPERRYTTADELGEDIRRHLDGKPIEARSESFGYRAGKFVQRHRVGVGLTVMGVVMAVGFGFFHTAQLTAERDRAQAEAEKARQVSEFVKKIFAVSDPTDSEAGELSAREVLDRGATQLESELADQPEILADLYDVVGDVYDGLGLYDEMFATYMKALAIRETLWGPANLDVATSQLKAGRVLLRAGRTAGRHGEADSLLTLAVETRRELLGESDYLVAEAINSRGLAANFYGRYHEAESLYARAHQISVATAGPEDELSVTALSNLAVMYKALDRSEEADSIYAILESILRSASHSVKYPGLPLILSGRAGARRRLGDMEGAEALYRESLDLRREVYGPGHPEVAQASNNLAGFLIFRSRFDEAQPLLEDASEILSNTLRPDHPRFIGVTSNLSRVYAETGNLAAADSLRRVCIAANRATFGPIHVRVASDLGYLAEIQVKRGQYFEALTLQREALDIRIAVYGETNSRIADNLYELALIELKLGQEGEARRHLERAQALSVETRGEDHPQTEEIRAALEELGDS